MCSFVFAYQCLNKESSRSQSLCSSSETFNHFKMVLRFENTDLYDIMLYTCVCVCKRGTNGLCSLARTAPHFTCCLVAGGGNSGMSFVWEKQLDGHYYIALFHKCT